MKIGRPEAAEGVTMNTAQQDTEIKETVGLKSCNNCSRELREGDKFCRRCGANQNGRPRAEPPDATEAESKYKTSRLPEADDRHRFSGSLMKSLAGGVSARTSRINNRFAKLVVSILAAAPLWLMIVLLSPFDAYVAARSIANED
ncbi:MAG: zinc ribbon domain-containing protein [Blastocatellia bacterium]